jgi:4-amino-4-deoxy-L-arabinose transferase-like glycosyltransferase
MERLNQTRDGLPVKTSVAAAVVVLVCLFAHLGAIGLVGPDEPRYAWIARAMSTSGDWVTPRLFGSPWFEKPVLFYWVAAIGFQLHLPPEWAARLPSALGALLAALVLGWLAHKFYRERKSKGLKAALLAPLLFSTSVAAIGFARAATPDMLFCAMLTLSMACAIMALDRAGVFSAGAELTSREKQNDLVPLSLFGASLGLSVLAKGPAAIVLAGGAIGAWAVSTRNWRAAIRFLHPIAIVSFSVIALPWYVLCAIRNPDFVRVFIFEHNFERYLTPLFQHKQPFWYFGPIVCLGLLPWTVLLIPVTQKGLRLWRENSWADSPGFFLAWWAIFPILFFSLSQSKLPGYVLPAIPPIVLLCTPCAARMSHMSGVTRMAVAAGIGAVWVGFALCGLHFINRLPRSLLDQTGLLRVAWLFIPSSVLLAIVFVFWGTRRKSEFSIALCVICVALTVEFANLRILPIFDRVYSARPYAELVRHDRRPDRIFAWNLKRNWDYGFAFYFGRELPQWSPADHEPALVLTTPEGLRELERLGRFDGSLDEPWGEVLFVPVQPAPHGN